MIENEEKKEQKKKKRKKVKIVFPMLQQNVSFYDLIFLFNFLHANTG
jgi:hypothetical protein